MKYTIFPIITIFFASSLSASINSNELWKELELAKSSEVKTLKIEVAAIPFDSSEEFENRGPLFDNEDPTKIALDDDIDLNQLEAINEKTKNLGPPDNLFDQINLKSSSTLKSND